MSYLAEYGGDCLGCGIKSVSVRLGSRRMSILVLLVKGYRIVCRTDMEVGGTC